jgi:hypothetical protein
MTEEFSPRGPDEALERDAAADEEPAPQGDPPPTGVPGVDAVLAEIDDLDQLPLDQHLAAFERAHDALRSALDTPADPLADDPA